MDLIYTDKNRKDLGVLLAYDLDLAYGGSENDFECTVGESNHVCEAGSFLYAEGTDYGGVVDTITRNTESNEVTYSGRTWQGILESKIIQPFPDEDYVTVVGDANEIIADIISMLELDELMTASSAESELYVADYQMQRYVGGYTGITKMLESVGAKLIVRFVDGMVVLEAQPIHDYSQDADFDSDLVDFTIAKSYNAVNHLICLGKGELKDRTVVHLYADADGNISQTPTFTGLEEYASVYDYANVESEEELIKSGTEKLKEMFGNDELSIEFNGDEESYDISDIVGAVDNVTKTNITAKVTKKIVNVKNGVVTVSYEVGGLNG